MLQNTRRKSKAKLAGIMGSLLLLAAISSGCNTRIEGCLELNANNFDLNAERACDDCCTYPSMTLSLSQKWDDLNFSNTDTIYDINAMPYQILDLRYFLSSWSWKDSDQLIYSVDSLSASCDVSTLVYTPDILTIDTRQFTYTLGIIRQSPVLDSLRLTCGLVEDFSCLDPDDHGTPSNLTDQSPLWNDAISGLETIRIIIQPGLDPNITDTIYITTRTSIKIPYVVELNPGKNGQLKLTVNYRLWFEGVDINDLNTFETSIINHLAESIFPTP